MSSYPHDHGEIFGVTRALARTQRRAPTRLEEILCVLRDPNDLLLGRSGDLVLEAIGQAVDPSSDLR
jgi:hypothetical protein